MQPAFAGSYRTVAISFGSSVTGYLPREHPLVKNGSSGDQFVEGTKPDFTGEMRVVGVDALNWPSPKLC